MVIYRCNVFGGYYCEGVVGFHISTLALRCWMLHCGHIAAGGKTHLVLLQILNISIFICAVRVWLVHTCEIIFQVWKVEVI